MCRSLPKTSLRALASVLIACLGVSVGLDAMSQTPADQADAARRAIREKVKAGKLNTCITDSVASAHDDQVIVLQNHCEKQVNVMLCVRVEGQSKSYFLLIIDSLSRARQRLAVQDVPKFEYRYNSCSGPYCVPPESDC